MYSKKYKNNESSFLIFLLFIVSFFLFYSENKIEKIEFTSIERPEPIDKKDKILDRLNYHIRGVGINSDLKRSKIKEQNVAINYKDLEEVEFDRGLDSDVMDAKYGVNIKGQDDFKNFNEDVKGEGNAQRKIIDGIYAQVALDEYFSDYKDQEREAFVEAFISNARADGLDIRLNKRLEITKVRKIKPGASRR